VGSNPTPPARNNNRLNSDFVTSRDYFHLLPTSIDWEDFKEYLNKVYRPNWSKQCFCYARKYYSFLENPSKLETFNGYTKNNIRKALIALSKYLGIYRQFKARMEDYGIKWSRSTSIDAFFRMINNKNNDVIKWLEENTKLLDRNCSTYLKFVLVSGLRTHEAIDSFNLIIKLNAEGKLGEYYKEECQTLEHFRYPKLFFRNTKNCFVTMIPKAIIKEITECTLVTYETIRKRLQRKKKSMRTNELRDYYATFMVRHGLIKEEVDLLQGRIGKSIFVRHYFSPAINELRNRVFNALSELQKAIPKREG